MEKEWIDEIDTNQTPIELLLTLWTDSYSPAIKPGRYNIVIDLPS
jgi:hypothetical protein